MKKILFILCLLPLFTIAQDDVYNGTRKPINIQLNSSKLSDTSFRAGHVAALKYYDGYKGAATATAIVAFLNPVLGLAPAIGTTSGTPGDTMHPEYDRMKNQQYYAGYTETARKMRSKRVWNNYLTGGLINVGIVAFFLVKANQ